jgi:hypothetical protein
MPTNAVRSAEGRCVRFPKKEGDAHAAGGLPARRALTTVSASRRSAPTACRGDQTRPAKADPRRPTAGPSYAADDFAWLSDK